MATATASVPVRLLREAEGHPITVELRTGEVYRGFLTGSDDLMNCRMRDVACTGRDGRIAKMDNVFIRGGQVKLVLLPDILKSAPLFKKVEVAVKTRTRATRGPKARGVLQPLQSKHLVSEALP